MLLLDVWRWLDTAAIFRRLTGRGGGPLSRLESKLGLKLLQLDEDLLSSFSDSRAKLDDAVVTLLPFEGTGLPENRCTESGRLSSAASRESESEKTFSFDFEPSEEE